MSTDAANRLSHGAINNTGIVRATTVAEQVGVIKLLGGETTVAGTLDASAPNGGDGGFIETSGHTVKIDPDVNISTQAASGVSGTWLIDPNDFTISATGGNMTGATLSNQLANGSVTIATATMGTPGNGDIFVNDPVNWSSGNKLTLLAERNIIVNANVQGNGVTTFRAGIFNGNNIVNDNAVITIVSGVTVSSSYAASYFESTNSFCGNTAALCLVAGRIDVQGNLVAANQMALISTYAQRALVLGADDVNQSVANGGKMGLTQDELSRIYAKILFMGNTAMGVGAQNIEVSASVEFPNVSSAVGIGTTQNVVFNAPIRAVNLGFLLGGQTTGALLQTNQGVVTSTNLQITGNGNVLLDTANNDIQNIVSNNSGSFKLNNGSNSLATQTQNALLNGVAVSGIRSGGDVFIKTGGDITTSAVIKAEGFLIDLHADGKINLGGSIVSDNSSAKLRLNAGGDIKRTDTTMPINVNVFEMAIRAGGNVDFSNIPIAVNSLSANLTGSGKYLSYRSNGDTKVGDVDGLSGITTNNGNITIRSLGDLTVFNNLNAGSGLVLIESNAENKLFTLQSGAAISSTYAGPLTQGACGNSMAVCVRYDRMEILGSIAAPNQFVSLSPETDRAVVLGLGNVDALSSSGGRLGLTEQILSRITAKAIAITNDKSNVNGNYSISVDGAVQLSALSDLVLSTNRNITINKPLTVNGTIYAVMNDANGVPVGDLSQSQDGKITALGLSVMGRTVTLNTAENSIANISARLSDQFAYLGSSYAVATMSWPAIFSPVSGITAASIRLDSPGTISLNAPLNAPLILVNGVDVSKKEESLPAAETTQTVAETTVTAEASQASVVPVTSSAVNIVPDAGLGNGGATMQNFPTQTSTKPVTSSGQAVAVINEETVEPAPPPKLIVEASKAVPRLAGVLNRAELEEVAQQVRKGREKLFEQALSELAQNPNLADVPDCAADGSGLCISKPVVKNQADGYLPIVKRKVALLIGNNAYISPVPELETAVNDGCQRRAGDW